MQKVRIIGAGLAGCEAALTLADFGFFVDLFEMKPQKKTPAQKLDTPCELVCSNSFRSTKKSNAVGALKEEMQILNSRLLSFAHRCKVPAGDAFAVDRVQFSLMVDEALKKNSRITIINKEITELPNDDIPTVMATGPLTSEGLTKSLMKLIGNEFLDFYDAIAPIIDAESIDYSNAFKQSRWQHEEEGDYINCPLDENTYYAFVEKLNESKKAKAHSFEDAHYFEGCLPIEVLAERGKDTLRFGPFKPVGLKDKNTDLEPYAVLQLRKEDIYGSSYNLVGCQTRMLIPEQKEAFRLIPALKNARFLRFGSIHRNTYIDSPKVLDESFRVKINGEKVTNIYLAGQITGVEGYVESMAVGMMVARFINNRYSQSGHKFLFPKESLMGGLYAHVRGLNRANKKNKYVPSNVTWAMVPPLAKKRRMSRLEKRELQAERSINAMMAMV